jgi:hypothetical protein
MPNLELGGAKRRIMTMVVCAVLTGTVSQWESFRDRRRLTQTRPGIYFQHWQFLCRAMFTRNTRLASMFLKSGWRMTGLPSLSKQSMLATHAGRLFFEPGTRNSFVPSPRGWGRGLNLLSIIPKVWNYAFWTLY